MAYKVSAHITAYEDQEAVVECLKAIANQSYPIQEIIIIDNSSTSLHFPNVNIPVTVQKYPENIGVGSGLKKGLEWAIEKKFDFLWTFDQDSQPTENCLELLIQEYDRKSSNQYSISIIAPTVIDYQTGVIIEGCNFNDYRFHALKPDDLSSSYECDAPITSGSLINLELAQKIDFPTEELFIDAVDHDYGYRFKLAGFHNLILPQATMNHRFGKPKEWQFLGKSYRLQDYSPLRYYYIYRNYTYVSLLYAQQSLHLQVITQRTKDLIRKILVIIISPVKNKYLKVWACIWGTWHGFQGKLGKNW